MDIKECLQELHENFDLPAEEYKNLPGFKELEQQPDVVDKLLAYECPELVKLVCLSDKLSSIEFPYMEKLYLDASNENIGVMLQGIKNIMNLGTRVVEWADIIILNKIKGYFSGLEDSYNTLKNTQEQIIQERNKIVFKDTPKQEIESNEADAVDNPENVQEKQQELNEINKSLKELYNDIQSMAPYEGYVDGVIADYGANTERQIRYERACAAIELQDIKACLNEYMRTLHIPEKYKRLDYKAVANLLQVLAGNAYEQYRITILVNLHEAGALKLLDKAVTKFLLSHAKNVNDFLVALMTSGEEVKPLLIKSLLHVLLQIESEKINQSYITRDIDVWKYINDEKLWLWIFRRLSDKLDGQDIVPVISDILSRLEDNAGIFVKALMKQEATDKMFSGFKLAKQLVASGTVSNRAVLLTLLDALERKQVASRREINRLERGERSRSQELFSAIYQPIEKLEELTVNLKTNKEYIPRDRVGEHLATLLIAFREGLEDVGLYPLAELNDWQNQRAISFSEECHERPKTNNFQFVKLCTMGFRYENEDGEEVKRLAQVYTPQDIQAAKPKKLNKSSHRGKRVNEKAKMSGKNFNNRKNNEVKNR